MDETTKNVTATVVAGVIIVVAMFGGVEVKWEFDKDWVSLYREDVLIAKEKWMVEAERTYFKLDSWYDKNVKCPKIEDLGGYRTETRCYYPDDYYEQLSRSLINTKLELENTSKSYIVTKTVPSYKYGTKGAYAGKVKEVMVFEPPTSEENFPTSYTVSWKPTDTRNYRLVWRVESLKHVELPDGNYTNCDYTFGYVKIDLKDECEKLDYAEIKDNSKIYFHFKNQRKEQEFDITLVDPVWEETEIVNLTLTENCTYNVTYYNVTVDNPYWTWNCILNATGCPNATGCYCKDNVTLCEEGYACNGTYHHNYTEVTHNHTTLLYCDQVVGVNNTYFIPRINVSFANDTLNCSLPDTTLCCDSQYDGNNNGVCTSGESFIMMLDEEDKIIIEAADHLSPFYEGFLREKGVIP